MKQLSKLLIPFVLILFLFSISAAAAPAAVTNLRAVTSENNIKLSWNKASGAKGYKIYRVDAATGAMKYFKSTKSTSYLIKKCSYGVTYNFKVVAYDKSKKTGPESNVASATPIAGAPSTPGGFKLLYLGNKSATLKWNKASKATGYHIECYDTTSNSWYVYKTIKNASTKKSTVYNLNTDKETLFRIVALRSINGKTLYSAPSPTVTVKATTISKDVMNVRAPRYKVKVKTATTASVKGGGTIHLAKGTTLTASSKTGSTVTGYLANGTSITVRRSALSYYGLDCSSHNDYSSSVKTNFVNSRGIQSKTKWLIWISEYKLKVNIFSKVNGKWSLRRVAPCVVGKWNTRTAGGFRKIIKKAPHGQYGGPVVHFSRGEGSTANPTGCAFHHKVDSTMSKAASHGCIRLNMSDLCYIYNNCPVGTTVYVY